MLPNYYSILNKQPRVESSKAKERDEDLEDTISFGE